MVRSAPLPLRFAPLMVLGLGMLLSACGGDGVANVAAASGVAGDSAQAAAPTAVSSQAPAAQMEAQASQQVAAPAQALVASAPATVIVPTASTAPANAPATPATVTTPATPTAPAKPATPVNPVNASPVISGTAPTSVSVGQAYVFKPTASDPEGKAIGFSIANKPAWITFNTATGQMSGTPAAANVGTTAGIVISVSDGTSSAALPAFALQVLAAPNTAPTISGSPATTVTSGSAYDFLPAATDANSDPLTFSISNKPAWATFDAASGRLSGTPTSANAGSYANIVIAVSDGKVSTALAAFTITVNQVSNGTATLHWTPPTAYSDGSSLSIAGYRVYYGTSQVAIAQQAQLGAGTTTYIAQNLAAGTYYFAVTSVDVAGIESEMSGVASKTIQ